MCGIFALLDKKTDLPRETEFQKIFQKIKNRGPDYSYFQKLGNIYLGFHRLAINGLGLDGNQPFFHNDDFLICNGEIYNHKFLEEKYNITPSSGSDCEFLLPFFKKKGINQESISEIDGVFAIILRINGTLYAIRDRIGVRPLFIYQSQDYIGLASTPQSLEFDFETENNTNISEIKPSTFITLNNNFTITEEIYYHLPLVKPSFHITLGIVKTVKTLLTAAVKKRLMSDRPVGCLLSGGLDSSIIASLLSLEYKKIGKKIKTFSIGFPDSTDLVYARKVAEFIGSDHHEHIIQYNDAISLIPQVVRELGTFDITTIRASTPMWILCKWISENFDEKVLYSGEGSDEVFGGYLYFHSAPTNVEFANESYRLVSELYKYDVLRADRCVSSNGLDLREPFLDKDLINYYLTIPGNYRSPKDGYEKWILRKAFEDILPSEVAWRRKAAFSDAVSSSEKPWYKYIQEWADQNYPDYDKSFPSSESYYYKQLFLENHKIYKPDITYWLPKWQKTDKIDPSATTLKIFRKNEH